MLWRIVDWLFASPDDPESSGCIVAWWEVRRIPFNLIVGGYGFVCLVVFFAAITTSGHLGPGEDAVEPLALIAAPIAINLLYTLGWTVEVVYRSIEPDVSPRFGPRLLALGLALGLSLCTLPAAFWGGYRILEWVGVAS